MRITCHDTASWSGIRLVRIRSFLVHLFPSFDVDYRSCSAQSSMACPETSSTTLTAIARQLRLTVHVPLLLQRSASNSAENRRVQGSCQTTRLPYSTPARRGIDPIGSCHCVPHTTASMPSMRHLPPRYLQRHASIIHLNALDAEEEDKPTTFNRQFFPGAATLSLSVNRRPTIILEHNSRGSHSDDTRDEGAGNGQHTSLVVLTYLPKQRVLCHRCLINPFRAAL